MNKLFKNYIFNLAYEVLALFAPLVTAPYLARVLGPEGTGIYSYVHSNVALLTSLVMLGVFSYGCRQVAYVRDDSAKLDETFWGIMSARFVIFIVGTIAYIIITAVNRKYIMFFVVYYLYFLGYCVDCTWLFVGVEDMKWATAKNALMKVIAVAGIFVLVKTRKDAMIYVMIQGGSILLANVLAYTQIRRYVGRARFLFKNVRKDLLESAKLYLPSVAATIYLQCDKIMLEGLTGATAQVSYYDYAEKIVTIPLSFIKCLSTVMMPRIANEFHNKHTETISALLNRAARLSLYMAFPLMCGIMAIADSLIPWYLGKEFLPVISAIIIISPLVLTNTMTGISGGQYFTATNQIGVLLKSQIAAAIGNVLMNLLLIPHYGFMGAAIATLTSSVLCAVVQYWYLCRQVRLSGLLCCALKYGVLSAIMVAVIRLTTGTMSPTPMTTALQICIGCLFYFTVCILIRDEQTTFLFDKIKSLVRKG